ncbi:multidrug resistance protein homolog 65-like [Condylostylus longicornis]|uniref:multidrug resistance protein homolog 65-like n=1 Tax=Condylostylus longicornis TaxID=2530218 RepID=UPI00244DF029|nr:multidrug resistance protein homolog 65-like [Condylostylus longicornis]
MTAYDVSNKDEQKSKSISYFSLFRFATSTEIFLLFLAFFVTIIKALTLPIMIIVYSEFTSMLVDRTYGSGTSSKTYLLPLLGGGQILTNATAEENDDALYYDSMAYGGLFFIFSTIMFLTGIAGVDLFNYVALKQVVRIRIKLFQSAIRQDIGWHDMTKDQNFAQKITDDIEKIREGIAEKLSHFINLIGGTLITMIISYIYGWKLALSLSIYIPIVILTHYYVLKYQSILTSRELNSFAKAGNLLEEILSSVRTVVAFGGEKKEVEHYGTLLVSARKASERKGAFSGFGEGVSRLLMFICCSGAIWYGIHLIIDDRDKTVKEYTPATMLIAFFGIVVGADNIAKSSPFLEAFGTARGAAIEVFKMIDLKSKIDPLSTTGKISNIESKGIIEFEDVFFRYPSRQDIIILRGISINIESGQTVALVGSSGCGKSTCIQLIQRFYDPDFGQIKLDGLDIRKYNLNWLRSNIAIVGQEPVLFFGTIVDNIRSGKTSATDKEVEEAAKSAGAHNFIINLPHGYQTKIGEKGTQLSGGQKQRIAIARALIQNPKILLLDEATSALDYESEKLVQQALDLASKGRTTIVVSHRLSAIKGADKIVYIDHGKVLEEGTHDELMQLNGHYNKMVSSIDLDIKNNENVDNIEDDLDLYKKTFDLDTKNLNYNIMNKKKSIISNSSSLKNFEAIQNYQSTDDLENIKRANVSKVFQRILSISKPEWGYLFLGIIGAAGVGSSYPCMTLLMAEFYKTLANPDPDDAINHIRILSILFLVLGFVFGLTCFMQTYLFNLSGCRLSSRLRLETFKSIIKQEMSWFDKDENSAASLSARLSGDASSVQGALGFPLSGIIQAVTTFTISVTIAFYFSWNLTLLCLVCTPFIVGSVIVEYRINEKTAIKSKKILEDASRVATEAIINIRTVAGLRREKYVIEKFENEMYNVQNILRKKLRFRGLINSFGQTIMFFGYTFALAYGGILVSKREIDFQNILKVSETLLYGSMMLAQSLAFSPAFGAALFAGNRLFKLIDRTPKIRSPIPIDKNRAISNSFQGVEYKNINFRYPTRPEAQILKNLNLQIFKGRTVAFVGHSGCGKSTCIQLLQRFYEPETGKINIEHGNISTDMTLEKLRSNLGIVSQEPILFERSIAQNIAYGDNSRIVTMDEIIDAAKQANAHNFITSLPNGYETNLGSRGTQLSGGQKQRIAIARALVRNPNILLLDEATSALDLQSEKIVQSALDSACSGRTCIIIAHRLSTVQNADLICVFENGKIAELGNHQQLLAENGLYYKLYTTQPNLS